jgi:Family of unknown function (DUF6093)
VPIDLARARARVSDLLFHPATADTCRITRDTGSTDDDTLHGATLALVPPTGDTVAVYEGPCVLVARGPSGRTNYGLATEGGVPEWAGLYTLKLPLSAPMPAGGDTVAMLTSQDPGSVGLILRIRGPVVGTFKVTRQVECELRGA